MDVYIDEEILGKLDINSKLGFLISGVVNSLWPFWGLIKGTWCLPKFFLLIFLGRKSKTTLANIYIRSKLKLYKDSHLVYKLTLFIKFHQLRKLLHMFKLGWVNLLEHPFSGFLIYLIVYCFNSFYFLAQSAGAVEYTDCTSAEG